MASASSPPASSLVLFLSLYLLILSHASDTTEIEGIDPSLPVLDVSPVPLSGHPWIYGSKDVTSCERVQVSGHSRRKLGSYANSFRISVAPSAAIPDKHHSKIQVCFHRNASLGLCQCEKHEWKTIQNGLWSSVMSPYEQKYIDVMFNGEVSGSVSVSVEEDFQRWRLFCLAVGFILLLIAPIVSSWVPFYYSSSMAIGVLLVILIILFQGMKLLPTGRKNILYLTLYGSVLGAGSFLLHQFSMMVNMILVNFGLSEEMHNPVAILVLVGLVLAGAALGYWIVRKFVISKDGSVDAGVAQFVKWGMRVIASTFILQSTLDTPLAMGSLVSCNTVYYLISFARRRSQLRRDGSPWQHRSRQTFATHSRAEFLGRSSKLSPGRNLWNSSNNSPTWSSSPVKGVVSPSTVKPAKVQGDFYSTFHKTPNRKRFTKKEWEEFTRESTRQAVAGLAATPEFTDWMIEHADRIQLLPSESSEGTVGSESDSTDDNVVQSYKRLGLSDW